MITGTHQVNYMHIFAGSKRFWQWG